MILIQTRHGKRRLGFVADIIHKAETETLVSLAGATLPLPSTKKAK